MARTAVQTSIAVLVLALAWGGSWIDYGNHVEEHRAEHRELTTALVGATQGTVAWLFRGGVYNAQHLDEALDEIRTGMGATSLALAGPDGRELARVHCEPPAPPSAAGLYVSEFDPPRPRGRGRGMQALSGMVDLPAGSLRLELGIPHAALDRRLRSDFRRFLWSGSALTISALLLLILFGVRTRSLVLAERLEAAKEKLAGLEFLRRLGAGLAHETRNPLGIVRGFAQQLIEKESDPAQTRSSARTIVEQTDRTLARLDEFLLLSRPATLQRVPFDLHQILTELARLLAPDLEEKDATLEVQDFALGVEADRDQVQRLFLNLLLNAVQAIEPGGSIRVASRACEGSREIRIQDTGPGIPAEIRETLFEPYVTRREGGTGLGLAIARRIADEHGWLLSCEAVATGGATFVIAIPLP